MKRREFFQNFSILLGGLALEQAIPNNRVWFFSKKIRFYKPQPIYPKFFAMKLTLERADSGIWKADKAIWTPIGSSQNALRREK